jgi:hypothetical protein
MSQQQQQPRIFITKSFFLSFIKQLKAINQLDITLKENIERVKMLTLLKDLLFYKATVFIDISDEDLYKYNHPGFIPETEEEKLFQQYFKILVAQNKVSTCYVEIQYFKQKKYEKFNEMERKPNYIFLSASADFCKEISEEFGVICISDKFSYCMEWFEIIKKTAPAKQDIDLNRTGNFINHLPYSHTIRITDPYLLNQEVKFIVELIKSLSATKVEIALTINVENKKGINTANKEKDIREKVPNLKLGRLIDGSKSFHNRNITTNTFWLSSDYGFERRYPNDEANWITFPMNKDYKPV